MSDVEQVPSLIGDIYDAALDPALWSGVMVKMRSFIGGSAAAVFSKDTVTKGLNVHYHCVGVDPHYTQLYIDTYAKLDPLSTAHVMADIGRPMSTVDIMAYDEFLQTRVYQEWVRPQGFVDCANVVLDKSATGAAMFGAFRQERHGRVDNVTCDRVRQISPHLRRAVLIGRAIELKTAEAATFADTLDGLSAGMFLVDAAGRIVHVNASGHVMRTESAVLYSAGCRLTPTDAKAAHALAKIVVAAGVGDMAVGIKGIAVPLAARDGEQYVAHVLPLTSGARRKAGAGMAAVAAVFIRKASIEAPSPPEIIARHYSLTPTELRVLLATVQVGGVPDVAEALGVGEATVKTHLHRVFGKTGANRQADLVKLVAGFSNPLLG